jgi:hypothetical protein
MDRVMQGFGWETLGQEDHLEGVGVDARIIFKYIVKNSMRT